MCGILCCGPNESFPENILKECLKIMEPRGPDRSSITINKMKGISYLTTQLMIVGEDPFPLNIRGYILFGNIEIYEYKTLYNDYLEEYLDWKSSNNDARIIIPLFLKFLNQYEDLEESFRSTLRLIKEDFSFIMLDSNNTIFVARDPVGIRPLFYAVNNRMDWAFCSMIEPLINLGFSTDEIKSVPPGTYLISNIKEMSENTQWKPILPFYEILHTIRASKINSQIEREFNIKNKELKELLMKSIEKRIPDTPFSLFLSGGIDSSLILGLLLEIAPERNFNVICVGFPGSSDLETSKKLCSYVDINPEVVELNKSMVLESVKPVKNLLKSRNKIILKERSVSPIEISIALPFYFASLHAYSIKNKVAFSGQGADELFIGYKKYYLPPYDSNQRELSYFLMKDLTAIAHQNLERDDIISMHTSVEMRFPYLDLDVINWVIHNDLSLFYENNDNRKQILRNIAAEIGLPDYVVNRKKKAAQYGTNIMKTLKQESKSFNSLSDYINSL